jgi:hypothetical protein
MPNIIQFPSEFDAINERCMTGEQRQAAREALERHYAEERERLENGRAAMSFEPETFAALVDYLASKKQPTQNAEGVHVGDLFYCSWGYEQTNIDYFQVVALKGAHTAVLREIGCEYIGGFGMTGNKRPLRNHFTSEETYTVRTRKSRYYQDGRVEIKAPNLSGCHYLTATDDFAEHAYTSYA